MSPRKSKHAQLAFQCTPETAAKLKALSERTLIPQSKLLRKALDLLFVEYSDVLQEPKSSKARK